jgi:hypothetical protein
MQSSINLLHLNAPGVIHYTGKRISFINRVFRQVQNSCSYLRIPIGVINFMYDVITSWALSICHNHFAYHPTFNMWHGMRIWYRSRTNIRTAHISPWFIDDTILSCIDHTYFRYRHVMIWCQNSPMCPSLLELLWVMVHRIIIDQHGSWWDSQNMGRCFGSNTSWTALMQGSARVKLGYLKPLS